MNCGIALKDTLSETNYRTRCRTSNDFGLSRAIRKQHPPSNLQLMQHLNIEVETLMEKLQQKVALDERKTQQNSQLLNEVHIELQRRESRREEEKQMQGMVRSRKDHFRSKLEDKKMRIGGTVNRVRQQINNFEEGVATCQKLLERQKEEREEIFVSLIDDLEREMVELQRSLRSIRDNDQNSFEQLELSLFNLQEKCGTQMDEECSKRAKQHQTVTQLISHTIQNIRHLY